MIIIILLFKILFGGLQLKTKIQEIRKLLSIVPSTVILTLLTLQ